MPRRDISTETAASTRAESGGSVGRGVAAIEVKAAPSASQRSTAPSSRGRLFQPILVLQLLGQVLLGDEADATPGEGFELELLSALHHLLDLALPAGVLEPLIGEHLLRAVVVAVVHLDGHV